MLKKDDIVEYVGKTTPEMLGAIGIVSLRYFHSNHTTVVSVNWIYAPTQTPIKIWYTSNLRKIGECDAD